MRHTLRGHTDTVVGVAFDPHGKRLATAATDGTIKVWDPATGKEICTLRGKAYGSGHVRLCYNRDGTRLVSVGPDGIRMWDTATGKTVPTFKGCREYVRAVAFRPDGQRIAIVNNDLVVQTVESVTGNVDRTCESRAASVTDIAYSPDGKLLVTGGAYNGENGENTVQLWDADSGKPIRTLVGHTAFVMSAVFSPDGRFVASTGFDKTVSIWESATGKRLVSFKAHTNGVTDLVYHPGGKRLATASWDKSVRIWDVDRILHAAQPPANHKS